MVVHRALTRLAQSRYKRRLRFALMRFLTIGLLSLLLLPTALAAATRTVTAPAHVTALAFDGGRVAFASGRSARDCNRVQVWDPTTRGVTTFPRPTNCVATSTGSGISGVAIAGNRVLWVHFIGGNQREWTLWTATTSRPKPIRLRFVSRDVDDRPPLLVGNSSRLGDILPYALDDEVIALGANGARRFTWTAPGRVVALSAGDGELAVASGRTVTVLGAAGAVLRSETFPSDVQAVRLTRGTLVVHRGSTLELRGQGGPRTWTLPRNARLDDAQGTSAYYVHAGQVIELRLDADNVRRTVGSGSHVRVDGARVAFSNGRQVLLRQRAR